MADPRSQLFQMTCCGTFVPWQPPKPGGRWGGNDWYEVEQCPNLYCPTRVISKTVHKDNHDEQSS